MSPIGRLAKQLTAISFASFVATAILGAQSSGSQRPSGIYLESPDRAAEPTRLETSMPMMQVDGVGKAMLTGGLLKPHMVTRLSGETSAHRASSTPSFVFVFVDPKQSRNQTAQSNQGMPEMSALPMGMSSPKDLSLVRLTVADGQRQSDSGKTQEIKIQIESLATKTEFRVRPAAPLEPGEYGFTPHGGGAIWDFGVDAAK